MAWLDDSPVRQVGHFYEWKNRSTTTMRTDATKGFWQFLFNVPMLSILIQYLQTFLALKKLASLQQKITAQPLDTLAEVLALLAQLHKLKQRNHLLADPIRFKIQETKQLIVAKSYARLSTEDAELNGLGSSHRKIVDSLGITTSNAPNDKIIPTTLYWRHVKRNCASHTEPTFPLAKPVFHNLCTNRLLDMWKNPQSLGIADNPVMGDYDLENMTPPQATLSP